MACPGTKSLPTSWKKQRITRVIVLYTDMVDTYNRNVAGKLNEMQNRINKLQRTYMQAQMEVMKEKKFYPDANSTLRVTYGNVKGYNARDAVKYDHYTYLDGVMEKYKPGDYEFDVPEKIWKTYIGTKIMANTGKMEKCRFVLSPPIIPPAAIPEARHWMLTATWSVSILTGSGKER